jgi:hypothetical protein
LTRIESRAFAYCSFLKSIIIPRHVQILCSECFLECNSLSLILFKGGSESTCIEADAFSGTSLSSVVVPENASLIGDGFLPWVFWISQGRTCGIW